MYPHVYIRIYTWHERARAFEPERLIPVNYVRGPKFNIFTQRSERRDSLPWCVRLVLRGT